MPNKKFNKKKKLSSKEIIVRTISIIMVLVMLVTVVFSLIMGYLSL